MRSSEAVNYRGLWSAVILQAFVDLKPRKFLTPHPIVKITGNKKEDKARLMRALENRRATKKTWDDTRRSAWVWIFSADDYPTSFLWICECLEIDPEYLRGLAMSREGINKVLTGKAL